MTNQERLSTIQSYAWTLELLGEALVQHDEMLECEHNPHLSAFATRPVSIRRSGSSAVWPVSSVGR